MPKRLGLRLRYARWRLPSARVWCTPGNTSACAYPSKPYTQAQAAAAAAEASALEAAKHARLAHTVAALTAAHAAAQSFNMARTPCVRF